MKRLIAMLLILVFVTSILSAQITVFSEDFDSSLDLPDGWVDRSSQGVSIVSGIGVDGSNAVKVHAYADFENWDEGTLWLYTPVFYDLPLRAELKFDFRFMASGSTTQPGYTWGMGDSFGIFLSNESMHMNSGVNIWELQDYMPSVNYRTISIPLDDYEGMTGRVFFNTGFFSDVDIDIHIDNVRIEAVERETHDLRTLTLTGRPNPTANLSYCYTLTVRNIGLQTVAGGDYTVSLYLTDGSNDTLIEMLEGREIVPLARENFAFIWTPSEAGTTQIYGLVSYSDDDDQTNNQSAIEFVYVQPEGIVYIGNHISVDYLYDIPFSLYSFESLVQTIYYKDELNEGEITSLGYRFTQAGEYPGFFGYPDEPKAVKIWMKQTDKEIFIDETDVESFTDFTLVYDGTIPVDIEGENDIEITLQTPFVYDTEHAAGENIVIMTQRMHEPIMYDEGNSWQATPTPSLARTIYCYSYNDPLSDLSDGYPDFESPLKWITNIFMNVLAGPFGIVTGYVTDNTGVPMPGVYISITGTGRKVLTDADGHYIFRMLPIGNISITASKRGWLDTVNGEIVTLENQSIAVDIVMSLHPKVMVTGVILSPDSGIGVEGATVKLSGYEDYQAITGTGGLFTISEVYNNLTYTVTVTTPRYREYTAQVAIGDTDYTIPPITPDEILLTPQMVRAVVNPDNGSQTIVSWVNPLWAQSTFSHARPRWERFMGGTSVNTPWTIAHRYTSEQLAGFEVSGYDLYKVSFIPGNEVAQYTLKVWVTDDDNMAFPENLEPVYSVPVVDITYWQLKEVMLPYIPIPPNGQLFVGLELIDLVAEIYGPASFEFSGANSGYSDLLLQNGVCVSTGLDWGFPLAWCIYLSAIEPDTDGALPVVYSTMSEPSRNKGVSTGKPTITGAKSTVPIENLVLGHKVNRVTRAFTGDIEVYRMLSTETLTGTPIATPNFNFNRRDMRYIDNDWGGLSSQAVYKYALRARYTGSEYTDGYLVSEPVYSNTLLKGSLASVTVNVEYQEDTTEGATISFTNDFPEIPNQSYTLTTGDNGSHAFTIYMGFTYEVSVSLPGFQTYINRHTFTSMQNTLNVVLLAIQTVYYETLHGQQPIYWTNFDADEDGYSWNFNNSSVAGPSEATAAYSQSWDWGPNNEGLVLQPDNWLITPVIDLQDSPLIVFGIFVSAQENETLGDRLLIYIAPVDDGEPGWETFLENRNTSTGVTGDPAIEVLKTGVTLLEDHTIRDNSYYPLQYNISSYSGQSVRIAFRHAFCEERYIVRIGNMIIRSISYVPIVVSGNVVDESGNSVSGATVTISSALPTSATTDDSGNFALSNVPGNATYTVTVYKQGFKTNNNTQIVVGNGNYTISNPIVLQDPLSEADVVKPDVTVLKSNYPNPFNPSTTIAFDLARDGAVSIDVYNIKGQKVKEVVSGSFSAGSHRVFWNGEDSTGRAVGSGIYFYRMQTEGYTAVKKMLLMK